MRFSYLTIVFAVAALALAGCHKSSSKQPAAELSGDWAVIGMEDDGYVATADEVKGMKWSIVGNEITGTNPDGSTGKMSIRLNAEKTPKEIDITALDGNRQGKTDPGIYSVDQGVLRVSYAMDGERPKSFHPSGEGGLIVLEQIRQ